VAGNTTIVGGTNGWQADGTGNVTITADTITGVSGVALTGGATGSPDPSIAVAAGGTLEIDTDTVVNLGPAGKLEMVVTGGESAVLKGAGSVVAGRTNITAGGTATANKWMATSASGGKITISANAIAGTTGDEILTAGDNTAIIAVTAVTTDSANATLTVTKASVDINTAGKVILTGDNTTYSAILKLVGGATPAALVIDSTQGSNVSGMTNAKLIIGDASGAANPAEIKVNNAAATTANIGNVMVMAASATPTVATAVYKLAAGDTETTKDLWIVSATGSSAPTALIKGNEVLDSN
jgi:hypothetical protein